MKLRLAFLFALCAASTCSALLWIVPSRFSAGGGAETMFASQQTTNDYFYVNNGTSQWQKIKNSTARNISKVTLLIGTGGGPRLSHIEIWSDSARAGTKYGASSGSVGITQNGGGIGGDYYDYTWSGTKPNPTGDFYLHVLNDDTGGDLYWTMQSGDPYETGNGYSNSYGGGWDYWFKIFSL